jgi:hypothetical protein
MNTCSDSRLYHIYYRCMYASYSTIVCVRFGFDANRTRSLHMYICICRVYASIIVCRMCSVTAQCIIDNLKDCIGAGAAQVHFGNVDDSPRCVRPTRVSLGHDRDDVFLLQHGCVHRCRIQIVSTSMRYV